MCYVCKYVGHGITLSRYTAWYNVRVWRSACRLENHSILCYSIRRFTCVKSGVYTYLRQLRLNHVNERLSSRQCQKKSNWYGTRLRTAPVMQRIRMAAVPQLWAPCHEGVWRSGGIDPPHWYPLDGRRRGSPEEPFCTLRRAENYLAGHRAPIRWT